MMNDLGLALRGLRRSPGFAVIAVASLAIGIGASTAVFSFLNAVRLRALPVRAPHELRLVSWMGRNPKMNSYTGGGETKVGGGFRAGGSFPYPAYREFRDRGTGFASLFAFFPMPRITVLARSEPTTADGLMVSGNFFTGYGASTLIGRPLAPEDDRPGAPAVAVITYRMWEREFGLDPHALGRTLLLNRNAVTVVGVLPRDYVGPLPGDFADFYVPLAAQPTLVPSRPLDSSSRWWIRVMGRLAPGADEQQAQAALSVLFRQVLASSSSKMDDPGILLQDGAHGAELGLRNSMAAGSLALLAIIGVVLAIACANVAGLLLARGAVRQHELAVRAAIGAGRWRLIRQSLTESLLLGLAAAAGGLLLAGWGKAILLRTFGGMVESARLDLRADATVFAFALGSALVTAFVFGILPAWRSGRADPSSSLKSKAAAAPRLRLGRTLVAVQVALSALLIVLGGLAVRSFVNLTRVDPGFNAENVLLFRVNPAQAGYKGAALAAFYAEARRSIGAIPGVRSVAAASQALTGDGSEVSGIELRDGGAREGKSSDVSVLVASDGYLGTMGIPVVLGRDLAAGDVAESAPVAVVNETFARNYFPGESPIGRRFVLQDGRGRTFTIVGLARDARYASIREPVPPLAIFSSQQVERGALVFAVRSILPPLSIVPAARKAIAALDPSLPLSAVRTQAHVVGQSVAFDRITAGLCGGLAALALLLSCIGLYGLMAFNVARRTSEIGIRAALGANRGQLARPIVRDALLLTGAGLAIGLPVALAAARLAKSRLYGVSASDPVSFVVGVVVLLGVAALAAWIPARRAARVDPMLALRCE
jgi:predicted permease